MYFACLIMTAEDQTYWMERHARQNVIHEIGLTSQKYGFRRAIILLEQGVIKPSNIQGIQQIRFNQGRIKETFGDVVATIRREFNLIPNENF